MSQHPSLRQKGVHKKFRSVLKRFERLKILKEKGEWNEEKEPIYGLPKVKVVRFKVKKEKAAEATAEAAAAAGTEAAPGTTPQATATAEEAKKGTVKGKEEKKS